MLANRLLGRAHVHPVGDNTRTAEAALGLAESLYWSIGTSNSIYIGPTGTLWEANTAISSVDPQGQMTPFDTGGLHHGYIETDPPLDPSDHATYVAENTHAIAGWEARLADSINDCWSGSAVAYINGERPTAQLTTRSHDVPGNLSPAWLWEARLPLTAEAEAAVQVTDLFWQPASRVAFETFIDTTSALSADEAEALSVLLGAIAAETDSPVLALQTKLKAGAPSW